jgi:hypothetical protein
MIDFKKAAVFADGFEIVEFNGSFKISDPCSILWSENSIFRDEFELKVYPLFLVRVIEGLNKIHQIQVVTFYNGDKWWCFDCSDDKYKLPTTEHDTPEEAREAAINYILEKI